MKRIIVGTMVLLAGAVVMQSQSVPEAPSGFDGVTNGSVAQNVMDDASNTFQETETVSPSGLGPVYNNTSCVSCHQNAGVGGASQVTVLRAGHYEGGRPEWFREMRRRGDTNGSSGTFVAATALTANGTPIPNRSLINQRASCPDAQEHLTDVDNVRATRLSLPLFGDGYVEAVPDATLLAIAKNNGGEAVMVDTLENPGTQEVGRFGLKDQHNSLKSFASDAYLNEMGITNQLNPDEVTDVCNPTGIVEPNDVSDDTDAFTTFMRALKVPPRGPITADVQNGQVVFEKIGCAGCHVEDLTTAPSGTAIHGGAYVIGDAIGGKRFHPFGDFLMHDIGVGDGIVQNGPPDTANKVRTMPLWGLRTRTQLMHDGHTVTFSGAIERHRGEATDEARSFDQLSPSQKAQLDAFLGSL